VAHGPQKKPLDFVVIHITLIRVRIGLQLVGGSAIFRIC